MSTDTWTRLAERSIRTLAEKIGGLATGHVEEAARLAAVKAVNGPVSAKTVVTVKVVVERVGPRYELKSDASVSQTQTDKLDSEQEGFDPSQLVLGLAK